MCAVSSNEFAGNAKISEKLLRHRKFLRYSKWGIAGRSDKKLFCLRFDLPRTASSSKDLVGSIGEKKKSGLESNITGVMSSSQLTGNF